MASFVAEQLAPFKDADVDEVAVRIHPKLVFEYQLPFSPASLVESQISEEVAAQNFYLAETLSTCHSEAYLVFDLRNAAESCAVSQV